MDEIREAREFFREAKRSIERCKEIVSDPSGKIAATTGLTAAGTAGGLMAFYLGGAPLILATGFGTAIALSGYAAYFGARYLGELFKPIRQKLDEAKKLAEEGQSAEARRAFVEIYNLSGFDGLPEEEKSFLRKEIAGYCWQEGVEVAAGGENYEKACDHFEQAFRLDPGNPSYLESMVNCVILEDRLDRPWVRATLESLRTRMAGIALEDRAYLALASFFYKNGRPEAAAGILREALSRPFAEPFSRRRILEALLHAQPEDSATLRELGELHLREGDWHEATRYLQLATDAGVPVDIPLGIALYRKGDLRAGKERLEKAVSGGQEDPEALYILGKIHMEEGNPKRAEVLFSKISRGSESYYASGIVERVKLGLRRDDLTFCENLLERIPEEKSKEAVGLFRALADALRKAGEDRRAERLLEKASSLEDLPPFWRRYARLYDDKGAPVIAARDRIGVVYRARKRDTGEEVLIRELPGAFARESKRLDRFIREAEALKGFDSPYLLKMLDNALGEGSFFIAYESVKGNRLSDWMRGRREELLARSRKVILGLAEGIRYLHERNFCIRKLNPTRIFMTESGNPKISGLGYGKLLLDRQRVTTAVTTMEDALVEHFYDAPEVVLGIQKETGPGSDIYSLGAIAYEILAGRPPLVGKDMEDFERKLFEQKPEPLASATGFYVAPALEALLQAMLAKESSERPDIDQVLVRFAALLP
jgi:tetratricopeptide (TPR) repeat protein